MMWRTFSAVTGLAFAGLALLLLAACVQETGDDDAKPGGAPTETREDAPTVDAKDGAPSPTAVDSDGGGTDLEYQLIATDKTLPPGLVSSSVELADEQSTYRDFWDEYDFEQPAPAVDWDEHVVIFAGTGESGTCPLELKSVEHEPEEELLTLDVSVDMTSDTPCTEDWTPRTFVIAVEDAVVEGEDLEVRIFDSGHGPGEIHRERVMIDQSWYELVATEKSYPQERVGERVMELAQDQDRFDELWNWFGNEASEPPEIDWGSRIVLFAGTGESSGCPLALDSLKFDEEKRFIEVRASRDVPEDTMCTADWTPRVFVIAMDADRFGYGELRATISERRRDEHESTADDGVIIRED